MRAGPGRRLVEMLADTAAPAPQHRQYESVYRLTYLRGLIGIFVMFTQDLGRRRRTLRRLLLQLLAAS